MNEAADAAKGDAEGIAIALADAADSANGDTEVKVSYKPMPPG